MKVLFVCLGNICRSPTAEGVFKAMVAKKGLSDRIMSDSAGTSGHNTGAPADARSRNHASLRGYDLTSISRQLTKNDFFDFDIILTMDNTNYKRTRELALDVGANEDKVQKFTSYCKIHSIEEVPDPYYNGHDGFEQVLDIVEDACAELLESLVGKL